MRGRSALTGDLRLPPCRDGHPPEWDILSVDSAEVVCEERLGGVVKSFVPWAAWTGLIVFAADNLRGRCARAAVGHYFLHFSA
jgi:hypothetical protein